MLYFPKYDILEKVSLKWSLNVIDIGDIWYCT